MEKPKLISRNVWILSLVSLFTDMASEMLYPIMPLYLKEIGFSVVLIGVLEGLAEATAGLSKGYFGVWSDRKGKRAVFVQVGYSLSALSKPMMALFTNVAWIFGARTLDRLGKGLRTGARDALLSAEATVETKGAVFGFHRSMDTLGAMIGPAIALLFLYYHPGEYSLLFLLAFIPGALAVLAALAIRDKQVGATRTDTGLPSFKAFYSYWKRSPELYRKVAGALLVFSLINSSDVFLLLKMKEEAVSDSKLIGLYILYNALFAILAFPLGKLADRIGFRRVVVAGLMLFAAAYTVFAMADDVTWFIVAFLLYACYAAATEGIAKGWLTNIVKTDETASAIGTFTGFQSIAVLIASSVTGWLWFTIGGSNTLIISAFVAAVTGLYLMKVNAE